MLKLLKARKTPLGYRILIQLDSSKPVQDADGNQIEGNVREFNFGLTPPAGVAVATYEAAILAEAKDIARLVALANSPGTAFSGEGGTFSATKPVKRPKTPKQKR